LGGTPHLDQNYTVFGEVVQGMAVIDSIAKERTDALDRPMSDIRIRTVRELD
jgi:peptidyl-prolyl cis-trans isomerase B (cyclophilin B)